VRRRQERVLPVHAQGRELGQVRENRGVVAGAHDECAELQLFQLRAVDERSLRELGGHLESVENEHLQGDVARQYRRQESRYGVHLLVRVVAQAESGEVRVRLVREVPVEQGARTERRRV